MLLKNYAPLILLASIVVFVGCGSGSPVQNYQNTPIKASAEKKNQQNIRRAIIIAATNLGWQIREKSQGLIVATTYSGGKMAKVDINYTTESFNIIYKDSSNFQYDGANIHPLYNKWVKRLHSRISKNLTSM